MIETNSESMPEAHLLCGFPAAGRQLDGCVICCCMGCSGCCLVINCLSDGGLALVFIRPFQLMLWMVSGASKLLVGAKGLMYVAVNGKSLFH